LTDIGF